MIGREARPCKPTFGDGGQTEKVNGKWKPLSSRPNWTGRPRRATGGERAELGSRANLGPGRLARHGRPSDGTAFALTSVDDASAATPARGSGLGAAPIAT